MAETGAQATEGAKLAGRYTQHRIKKDTLRAFLRTHCGDAGKNLDALFDSRKLFNRSDQAGNLMQCLMFNIHKLAPMAGYSERCTLAMAYWMAADSYGKAGEKGYDQETDGYALIEKIVSERPRDDGGRWKAPFWAVDHLNPSAPPLVGYDAAGRRLGLAELVREALDMFARPSLKRVRAYVQMNAANPQAFSENGIAAVYQRELKRRQWAKRDAKLASKARNLRADVLKRKSQSTASCILASAGAITWSYHITQG